jgi:hypothetical protein
VGTKSRPRTTEQVLTEWVLRGGEGGRRRGGRGGGGEEEKEKQKEEEEEEEKEEAEEEDTCIQTLRVSLGRLRSG